MPKDNVLGFAQEEQPVLRLRPNVSVFAWVGIVPILMGIFSLVISPIWELPTYVFACMLISRRWLLVPYRAVWTLDQEILLPSLEKLMRFAL